MLRGGLRHGAQSRMVGLQVPRIPLEHENARVTCSSGKLRFGVLLSLEIGAAFMSACRVIVAINAHLMRREKLSALSEGKGSYMTGWAGRIST